MNRGIKSHVYAKRQTWICTMWQRSSFTPVLSIRIVLDSFNCLFSFLFTTLNLSNNFSSASLPVVTEDRIFKDNLLQKFNEFIGKISCHESFDCARYILRILGLRQSCLYNLRIKTKWLKLKYFCPFEKKGGPGTDHLEGKDRWEKGRGKPRRQQERDIRDVFNISLREVGILAETVSAVRSKMHNLW